MNTNTCIYLLYITIVMVYVCIFIHFELSLTHFFNLDTHYACTKRSIWHYIN